MAAKLPEEILCNIACRLGSDDLFNLRLTCRAFQANTFHEFATEYFTSKCVHFTTDSLKSLLAITESNSLLPHLQEVFVCTKWFTESLFIKECDCCATFEPPTKIAEAYRTFARDQLKLKTTGEDCRLLTKILKNVKKLERVGLVDNAGLLEHTVDYRGNRKIVRTTHHQASTVNPPPVYGYHDWLNHVFGTVLRAIKVSKVDVKALTFESADSQHALNVEHFDFAGYRTFRSLTSASFTSIKKLSLDLNFDEDGWPDYANLTFKRNGALFPNVTDLAVYFPGNKESDLAGLTFLAYFKMKQLERLTIVSVNLWFHDIELWFSLLDCIQVLKLENLGLVSHRPDQTWVELLAVIKDLATLQHLHIIFPFQDGNTIWFLKDRDLARPTTSHTSSGSRGIPNAEIYRRDFTNWSFTHDCGESIKYKCAHGPHDSPRRGNYICLPSKGDIDRLLPIFIEELHDGSALAGNDDNDDDDDDDEDDDEDDDMDSNEDDDK